MDGLWGSASAPAHRKSCSTVWESASVHWHVEKAHGWFVGVRKCIGTSIVMQHGLVSVSVHWHVEKAYGWFVGVRECTGTSKVLQHGLGVRECALARRKGPRMVCGGPRVHWHIESPAARFGVRECALARRKGLWMVCGGPRVHRHIESPATRFGSPRVCIGTSKRPSHGLWESAARSAYASAPQLESPTDSLTSEVFWGGFFFLDYFPPCFFLSHWSFVFFVMFVSYPVTSAGECCGRFCAAATG